MLREAFCALNSSKERVIFRVKSELEPQPLVAIVIVNYNSTGDLRRCLSSVNKLLYQNRLIIVVDNCSPDGSAPGIRSRGDVDLLLLETENHGFAGGCNIGVRQAIARGARYVWFLNPDVTVESAALSALLDAARARQRGAGFGSKVLFGDRRSSDNLIDEKAHKVSEDRSQGSESARQRQIWSAGGVIDRETQNSYMRGCREFDDGRWDSADRCSYLPGCSLLIPTSAFEAVGGFCPDYFMYFEETDWCARAAALGFECRYVPDSIVTHHFDDCKLQNACTVYYYNRNRREFWRRQLTGWKRLKLLLTALFKELPSALKAYFECRDAGQKAIFLALVRSCIDFLLGRMGRSAAR